MTATQIPIKFVTDIASAVAGFRQLGNEAGSLRDKVKNVGATMTASVTAPIVGGLALATKAAVDFDKVMGGISRSADIAGSTADATTELGKMGAEIRKIAPQVGMLPTEFAKIAAESAKLGVSGDRLLQFSRTVGEVAQIGDLTGEKVEELGKSFAALQTITKMNDTELKSFAASVNKLDDSIGGSMPDIIEFVRQTAASGQTLGIGTKQLAAYGSTMQALGIKTGVSYRAMDSILTKLAAPQVLSSSAVEGLETLGFTTTEMAAIMKRDAEGGIRIFLDRINELAKVDSSAARGAVQQLIGADFGNEILTLAAGTDKLNEALKAAGNDTANLAKYQEELAKKSQSVSGQMAISKAHLQSLGISLGLAILPSINAILGKLTPLVAGFSEFAAAHPKIVTVGVAIAGVVAAIGPLVWLVGSVSTAWGALSAAWVFAAPFVTGTLIPAISGIGAAMSALAVPIGLAVGALGIWIYNIRAYAANWDDAWLGMQYTAQQTLDFLGGLFSAGWDAGAGLIKGFVDGMQSHFSWATSAVSNFTTGIRSYLPFSPAKQGALSDLDKSGGALVTTLISGITANAPRLNNALDSALTGLGNATGGGNLPVPAAAGASGGNAPITINLSVSLGGGATEGAASLLEKFRPIAAQVGEEIERALGKSRRGKF